MSADYFRSAAALPGRSWSPRHALCVLLNVLAGLCFAGVALWLSVHTQTQAYDVMCTKYLAVMQAKHTAPCCCRYQTSTQALTNTCHTTRVATKISSCSPQWLHLDWAHQQSS